MVCLLAANRGSNCSLTRAMDGRIVRCGIISSCQSAATSEIVKRFWSRTYVRSGPFTFFYLLPPPKSVIAGVYVFIYLSVCLLAGLHKKLLADLAETWPNSEVARFWR